MLDQTNKIVFPSNHTYSKYQCQYLVIGTGAGGSVAGALLAEAGKEVIMLEEGGYYPTESFTPDITQMMSRLYRNQGIFPFLGAPTIAYTEGCCVGGGTVINGGVIWRTPPWVLEEWNSNELQGYDQKSLAPYFKKVEKDLNVVQTSLDEQDTNLDSKYLHEAALRLGWQSNSVPRAIKGCINENYCPTGCINGSKQSTLLTYLPRALNKGAKIFTHCKALKIIHAAGKARKVIAQVMDHPSKTIEIEFQYLIVSAGTINTAHLLKRSVVSPKAGKNFGFHLNIKIVGIFDKLFEADKGTIFTVEVNEFEKDGLLIMPSNMRASYVATTLSHFGNATINHVMKHFSHTGMYVAMIRPKSQAHIVSRFGTPLVWYSFHPTDLEQVKIALRRSIQLLLETGAKELYLPIRGTQVITNIDELEAYLAKLKPEQLELLSVHTMASCPMGGDPKSSVVDLRGRPWQMKNIFVIDGSILPTNIGQSPQGTIMAFAHKIINQHLQEPIG